jgi:hypothetical protein
MTDDEKKRIVTGPRKAGKSTDASMAAVKAVRGKIITNLPWPDEPSFWADEPESK